jgi:hypothetical protein
MSVSGKYSYSDILNCCLETRKTTLKKYQYSIFRWKFINGETYSKKNIMEHTICVILRLLSVEVLHTDIEYSTVVPPEFTEDSLSLSNRVTSPAPVDESTDKYTRRKHRIKKDKKSRNSPQNLEILLKDKKSRNSPQPASGSLPTNLQVIFGFFKTLFDPG